MKLYKVYKLKSPTGKVYIGITSRKPEHRWNYGKAYKSNSELTGDVRKYGWESFEKEILEENLPEAEAEEREIFWISFYKARDPERGYNIEYGGFHSPISEQTRKKMSESSKGQVRSEEYRRHIAEAKIGEKNGMYGKKGKDNPTSRKVIAVCKNGTVLDFESMMSANELLRLPEGAFKNISSCCRGKKRTAYGYIWRYADDKEVKRIS